MELITRDSRAAGAAEAWANQYPREKRDIFKALVALGAKPKPEDVNKVIGNDSWTRVACDECGEEVYAVVQIGQEPGYDSATAEVCLSCLVNAVELINA